MTWADPEVRKAYHRRYRAENREKIDARSKKFYADNPDHCKALSRDWQAKNPDRVRANGKRWRSENPEKVRAARTTPAARLWYNAKRNARVRKKECTLTAADVETLAQARFCAATGLPVQYVKRGQPDTASLDRIDSAKGYVLDNVRVVCLQYNYMKNIWTDEQCYLLAKALVDSPLI